MRERLAGVLGARSDWGWVDLGGLDLGWREFKGEASVSRVFLGL